MLKYLNYLYVPLGFRKFTDINLFLFRSLPSKIMVKFSPITEANARFTRDSTHNKNPVCVFAGATAALVPLLWRV